MSYLLKALEKAQQEREGQETASSAVNAPVVQQAQLPKSVLMIAVVLLGAVFYSVFKDNMPSRAMNAERLQEPQSERPLSTQAELVQNKQPIQVQSAKAESVAVDNNATPDRLDLNSEVVPGKAPELAPEVIAPLPATKALDIVELDSATLKALPSIQFQSHIYSSAADYRSVMLNDRSLKEGMPVSSDVRLKEITPSGIILEVKGVLVQLPKGQDWIAAN